MRVQEKADLMNILDQKKALLVRMLELTQKINKELQQDRIEAFGESIKARQTLISQVDELTRAEHGISAGDDIEVMGTKKAIRDIVAETLKLDEENTNLAQQKLQTYRDQIRQLNQTKKGVGGYTRPMSQGSAFYVDANK
jgi:hypothetical protein